MNTHPANPEPLNYQPLHSKLYTLHVKLEVLSPRMVSVVCICSSVVINGMHAFDVISMVIVTITHLHVLPQVSIFLLFLRLLLQFKVVVMTVNTTMILVVTILISIITHNTVDDINPALAMIRNVA